MKPVYAELFCRSNFSFQHGASHPEELVETAYDLGYGALAITDECSLAGVARAFTSWRDACEKRGHSIESSPLRLIVGACFRCDDSEIILLAKTLRGYEHLCQLVTRCRIDTDKGTYSFDPGELSAIRQCCAIIIPGSSSEVLGTLIEKTSLLSRAIGFVRKLTATDPLRFEHALSVAQKHALPLTACGDVLIHDKSRQGLRDILCAVRNHTTVDQLGGLAEQNAERCLRPLTALTHLYPAELLLNSVAIARLCTFTLAELRYQYPEEFVPAGLSAARYLRKLTRLGANRRYQNHIPSKVRSQLRKEFRLVTEKKYEAYFLTVYDIVREARRLEILCQGRGSSANSAICYCLHITELDPGRCHLLFERFISKERDEPPDIDVDFEHERREEIIQYVFKQYGRHRAALCATVICYRTKGAIRDVGKALGFSEDQLDRISRNLSWWDKRSELHQRLAEIGFDAQVHRVQQLLKYTAELRGFPRHLSQHPGGFVLAEHRLDKKVPIENATMPNRTVIQWDKDDIEELGMMKVDILGLGMLSCLRRSMALVAQQTGQPFTMHDIPKEDPAVYEMLCRGESTGVFQVESRAQMNMLPRLKPESYFDLVVQIAIVRPGPIQGGMVHPYLKRRQGVEAQSYPSSAVESILKRTLGIPIFQEQVMELSMKAAGFSAGEADNLRRSMAAWKRKGGIGPFRERLINGMLERGYTMEFCEQTRVDLFICWSTSRFARNRLDAALHKRTLARLGTKLVYVSQDFGDADDAWLTEAIIEVIDEQYSRTIAKDTRRSMRKNAEDGYWNGGKVPFGFETVAAGKRRKLAVRLRSGLRAGDVVASMGHNVFGVLLGHGNGQQARYMLAAYSTFGVMAPGLFGFFAVIRSGCALRCADPALTVQQMVFAIVAMAAAYVINPPLRGMLLMIVALALNNDQAKERFGELDIKLPYLRFAKA